MEPKSTVLSVIENPKQRVFSLAQEFEKFAFKGNVIDMAVGVIIGVAFGKIIDSLVKDIIMPLVNLLMPSNTNYTEWRWEIGGKSVPYGHFLGEIVNFLIVALALFFFTVKFVGWLRHFQRKEEETPPAVVPEDVKLLTEIRDLLKAGAASAQHPPSAGPV